MDTQQSVFITHRLKYQFSTSFYIERESYTFASLSVLIERVNFFSLENVYLFFFTQTTIFENEKNVVKKVENY